MQFQGKYIGDTVKTCFCKRRRTPPGEEGFYNEVGKSQKWK